MLAPRQLDTERLVLRRPRLSDAEAIFGGYAQDADVVRYLVWRPHRDVQETRAFLQRCLEAWEGGAAFPYALERRSDGRVVGMIEARVDGHCADVGYVLAKEHWGQGYATEALARLNAWLLDQEGIHRIGILCDVDNRASARVMEKAGMVLEGRLRRRLVHPNVSERPRDAFLYARVRPERPPA